MDSCFPPLASLSIRGPRTSPKQKIYSGSQEQYSSTTKLPPTQNTSSMAKVEVLQDLDLYYIRQIAHSLKEYDLEQKIELEIKMREGTTKLLAACRHQSQSLEAAKSLLTSNERMGSYMAELQRRKKEHIKQTDSIPPSLSRVCFSDLRLPLIWKDVDHFKNKGDYRRFAVFCLVRIGTEVYDTILLSPVDRSLTDLTVPDIVVFHHIPCNFEFRLEIYSHVLQDDLSIASTPRRLRQTIHSSISRTVGRRLAASLKDELNTNLGPKFDLVASAKLSLDDIHDCIRTHDLVFENLENPQNEVPLFGHFCCRLAAQPDCVNQAIKVGFLYILSHKKRPNNPVLHNGSTETMVSEESSLSSNHSSTLADSDAQFAVLKGFQLSFWDCKEAWEAGEENAGFVNISKDTCIKSLSVTSCEIHITTSRIAEIAIVKTFTPQEQADWISCLLSHTKDHERWQHVSDHVMTIHAPSTLNHPVHSWKTRQGSLYDETALTDDCVSCSPSLEDVFEPINDDIHIQTERLRTYSIGDPFAQRKSTTYRSVRIPGKTKE